MTEPEWYEILRRGETATIANSLVKLGLRNTVIQGVRPVDPANARFVGPAFTLRLIPAREDVTTPDIYRDPAHPYLAVVEAMPAGAVLVVDARRETMVGTVGDLMALRMKQRGIAGYVSDGGIRDSAEIRAIGVPVYGAAHAPAPPITMHHAVDMNVAIGCGGVAVYPGDMIVADGDGVVVIPAAMAEKVAGLVAEQQRFEAFAAEEIRGGASLVGLLPPDQAALARYAAWKGRMSGEGAAGSGNGKGETGNG